ncbi:MAG: hypothetical protein WKF34_07725 [Pyrinomonadaceae bacterium]
MKGFFKFLCLVSVLTVLGSSARGAVFVGSPADLTAIIVNGRLLNGPGSSARRQNGVVVLPFAAISRALGDTISLPTPTQIAVRRQTGETAEFDITSGRLNENGLLTLVLGGMSGVTAAAGVDELYLPVEVTAALLDATIRLDTNKNAVVVSRGGSFTHDPQKALGRDIVDLQRVDYDYGLNRYSSSTAHNLTLNAAGRLADGRFAFTSNSTRAAERSLAFRSTSFALERPNGQRYSLGDLGTGGELQFMSSSLRGGAVSVPFGGVNVTAFGGRTFSGGSLAAEPANVGASHRFDTTIVGSFVTLARARGVGFGAGVMMFEGAGRKGTFSSSNVSFSNSGLSIQADAAIGNFAGVRYDGTRFSGRGVALDIAATYRVSDELNLQGRYTRIGRNFLSPQSGVREPLDLKAGGLAWTPVKWLSASVNASTASRPGDPRHDSRFVTASVAVTPSASGPRFYISHTQSRGGLIRSGAFTLLNGSKDFSRLRIYLNATRIQNIGPATLGAQLGGTYTLTDSHSFEVSQSVGSGRGLNGQFDWRSSGFLGRRLSLAVGVGYSDARTSRVVAYERLSASLSLPRKSSLQISYFHANGSSVVLASLKGTLFRKREASAFLDSPVSSMNEYGKVSGRVYQDLDANGKFDEGIDKPQADVRIRVDGNRYVVSNADGRYLFSEVAVGDHRVYLDLLSIRADLTLLGGSARDTNLAAGGDLNQDFRLVRTGRIAGRVWLDANTNGRFDEGEMPLADVRVYATSGRDVLTDADGYFTLADLPPGEHVVILDEKTLPPKNESGVKPLAVQVLAGRETTDVNLWAIRLAAEVRNFTKGN